MNAPWSRIPGCKGSVGGERAIEVDRLIELLEPYRGQNRRVLVRGTGRTASFRKIDVDSDGDVILKGY